ncbi:cytochrome c [Sinisalibacter aestuarii]|uniref:Alcohol dehydrogenase n=1 Tax=Sinisalibacter aestuarii TaxID=2949426 RepID=A0ABQ5LX68_9RHOB|nr:cytochrome c [Sinisalibacter aestuarii]GKY89564.1 alcohol dehydrogenase [Sinisalibacter aestuarii]
MRTVYRILAAVAVIVVLAILGAFFWATSAPALDPIATPAADAFSDDEIERGELLARVGDCAACHTAPGGADYAGGFALPTPFGTIYSTNITPDPETGIGTWSYEAFARAMTEGLDREGNHLYPAFPYDFFAKTRDEDLRAIYAYLMTRDAVALPATDNELPFPFSYRPVLAGWKLLFLDRTPFSPDPELDEEENHGAYLAASLGHCGACHSPRNAFGAVIAERAFEGGEAEGWLAPPLGAHSIAPVGWTLDDYADYLFDGWSEPHGIAAGPMTSVADHLYDADEDDVFAIAAWFAAITPEQPEAEREAAIAAAEALDWPGTEGTLFDEEVSDPALLAGRDVFAANCAKCHKERIAETQPISLGLTYALHAPTPQNLFHVVREGIAPPYGVSNRKMEAISLSDEDLAAVAAYLRWHFTDEPAWTDMQPAEAGH